MLKAAVVNPIPRLSINKAPRANTFCLRRALEANRRSSMKPAKGEGECPLMA